VGGVDGTMRQDDSSRRNGTHAEHILFDVLEHGILRSAATKRPKRAAIGNAWHIRASCKSCSSDCFGRRFGSFHRPSSI
jgi:hypothetical protein